jgi:penicillin-binding protein 1C
MNSEISKSDESRISNPKSEILNSLRSDPQGVRANRRFRISDLRTRTRPISKFLLAGALILLCVLQILDWSFPLPRPGGSSPYALAIVARDGTPLRAFAGDDHVWRHPIQLSEVSPLYLEALVTYEDRQFWRHPGVNPIALVRAGWQWGFHRRIVSGGSTITMQVARIIAPQRRSVLGKLIQIARALQLERHYSKKEILTLYINYAPMGGVLEGVEAASRGYLGKPSIRLTHAEAALLTVLPQSPSRWRPDRYPARAQAARDKVLRRMRGRWSEPSITDALTEPVYAQTVREPLLAPLLAERLKRTVPGQTRLDTTIDAAVQSTLEGLLADRAGALPPHVSLASMVIDNTTLEVLGYAGSADFKDKDRFSDVDMVRASRSPGSALKPFLYGFALDEGLVHSESLLADVPQSFSGYDPANFEQSFHGPVSVSEALVSSLNVPAVEVLEQLGPARFVAMLRRGGFKLEFPRGAEPNLSVILGGAGAKLEDLVSAYSALGRKGLAGKPRFLPDTPTEEHRMMSEGAAYIIRSILQTGGPVGRATEGRGPYRGFAWKTGTSFGFRDAWAIGVSDHYTIGVWVGRPDGTPNPGFFGANAAAPLLTDIFNALPDALDAAPHAAPASVTEARICWPLGGRAADTDPHLCPIQRTAWLLDGAAPPTFADRFRSGSPVFTYLVDRVTHKRVSLGCAPHATEQIEAARWPSVLEPWLETSLRKSSLPPAWSEVCSATEDAGDGIAITGLKDGAVIRRPPGKDAPKARLEIRGSRGEVNWMMNGRLVSRQNAAVPQTLVFPESGRYDITAFDSQGRFSRISVSVQDPR